MMKKLLVATSIAGGSLLAGGLMASAYPAEDQASPVQPAPSPPPAAPQTPTPGATLPASGSESAMLLQIGLISLAAGGTLVGAAALRRRQHSGT